MAELTAADDDFHTPTDDDLFWTETSWFAFAVPERRLTGSIYPVFRTNQGICSCGIYLWDDQGEGLHEITYGQNYWHLPLPNDLRTMELPVGLSYEVLEPLNAYRVRYDDGADLRLDLRYEGIVEPFVFGDGEPAHLDQPCRVTGTVNLRGEEIAVDCIEMRDRSWSVRPDGRATMPDEVRVAYSYGHASERSGFQCTTLAFGDHDPALRSGYLLHDGKIAPLVSATRRAEYDRGRPVSIVVEGEDELGRGFQATGTVVNRFAFQATPGVFAWMSGVQWRLDDEDAWGEDQYMCPPNARVAALRAS